MNTPTAASSATTSEPGFSNENPHKNLEEIRTRLGLSRRQICKLLKVDPSAWTRWMKSKTGAPQHVHQSLQWYLQLVEQNPEVHAPQNLEKKIENSTRESDFQIQTLKREIAALKNVSTSKQDAMETLSNKIQETFENILIKFRDQMLPQKTLELEMLKYENRKLNDKLTDLHAKIEKALAQKSAQKTKEKRVEKKVKRKAKPKKNLSPKKKAKKKINVGVRSKERNRKNQTKKRR